MSIRIAVAASVLAIAAVSLPSQVSANTSRATAHPALPHPIAVAAAATKTQAPAQSAQAPAPAAQAPAATGPVRTEILRFDSWAATCHEFADPARKRTCNAQMQIQVQQQQQQQQTNLGQVALTWTLFINDNKQLVTVLQTPTGVMIAPGIEITLDKAPKRTIPFESCDTGFCTASQVIDNNLMRDLSAATTVQVTVKAMNGNAVNFNFPVKGTDKALSHLRSKI